MSPKLFTALVLSLLGITLGLTSPIHATQEQIFGLGGLSSARVGGLTCDPENPFAALTNPSLLPQSRQTRFAFSTQVARAYRDPLNDIRIDSKQYRTYEGRARNGSYEFPDETLSLWTASLQHPFPLPAWTKRRAGIGVVASGPFGNLRNFRSGTAYDFSPLRYGTSDSQFKATLSTGVEILPKRLYWGAGLSLFITAAGDADASILTEDPTARLNLDVGLNTAWVSGLSYRLEEPGSLHLFSLVYHQQTAPRFIQEIQGTVDLGVGRGEAAIPFRFETVLYYEPSSWSFDWQGDYTRFKVAVGIDWQRWSGYQPSYLVVETIASDRRVVRSHTPALNLKDTFNPKLSLEIPLDQRLSVGTGYQFRPSPLSDTSGETNLLDSDTHVFGAGTSYRLEGNEWFPIPLRLSVSGQYHLLSERQIIKSDAGYIGAPGYRYNGKAYSFGLLIEAQL